MKPTMKPADFFAEFRKPTENSGYKGYKVTNDENRPEIKAFSADQAVTQLSEARVTGVTDQGDHVPSSADRDASVTPVTQGPRTSGYNPNREKPTGNTGESKSVTPVTRVTHENDSVAEIRNITPVCSACHSTDLRVSPAGGLVCRGCGRFLMLRAGDDMPAVPAFPLRRCGALVCRDCRVHSPGPHREGCQAPRFEPCRSRWFWLSPYRAIKCVACASPPDLTLVEAWILARETGGGDDGWGIPGEILGLLHIETPMQ